MAGSVRRIVVGVATVDRVDPVLPFAARLAWQAQAELHVVHACELFSLALAGGLAGADSVAEKQQARAMEEGMRRMAVRYGDPEGVRCRVLSGPAAACIGEYAAQVHAELVVVGSTRRGPLLRQVLGTTAERVVEAAQVPVLVCHDPFLHPVENVLLATDLAAPSGAQTYRRSLAMVAALYGGAVREVRSLYVMQGDPTWLSPLRGMGLAAALELDRRLGDAPRPQRMVARVRAGRPAAEIAREAAVWKADLIVVGACGRTAFSRALDESVAVSAVRSAGCNVLVMPGAPRAACDAAAGGHAGRAAVEVG
ncbi:MAG TPA: universal stress protein [Longimicrobiaceae bacterium]|nr:universal stress protein [Longimicrobiaceae bacterium]